MRCQGEIVLENKLIERHLQISEKDEFPVHNIQDSDKHPFLHIIQNNLIWHVSNFLLFLPLRSDLLVRVTLFTTKESSLNSDILA